MRGGALDTKSIATDLARYLRGGDDVAAAEIEDDVDPAIQTILVRTQGGTRYIVTVEKAFGDVTTESSATE
jgi:hypothetical protein